MIVIVLALEIYKIHFSACSCNVDGSIGTNCNRDGKCTCKSNTFSGVKCEEKISKEGMFHFPKLGQYKDELQEWTGHSH